MARELRPRMRYPIDFRKKLAGTPSTVLERRWRIRSWAAERVERRFVQGHGKPLDHLPPIRDH